MPRESLEKVSYYPPTNVIDVFGEEAIENKRVLVIAASISAKR